MGRSLRIAALGPDSSYYIQFSDAAAGWCGLPIPLSNKLKGRQKSLPPVSLLALGPSAEYFVQFQDGKCYWGGGLETFAASVYSHNSTVEHVAFGPDGGWFIRFTDGCLDWWNLPADLANRLRGRQRHLPSMQQVALDDRGGYWVEFTNGFTWWGGLDSSLAEGLKDDSPSRVVFGCEGDYHMWRQDGSTCWRVSSQSFDKALGFIFLDPDVIRFTQNSINEKFTCYLNYTIYDLADDLQTGHVCAGAIERIRVVNVGGTYWSLDNRRLWAFKEAGLNVVPVKIVEPNGQFYRKRHNVDGGWTVRVRQA